MPLQLVALSHLCLLHVPLLSTDENETVTGIGELYNASKSSSEYCRVVQALTSAQMYSLLKNCNTPHQDYMFPKTYIAGCNRSFCHTWLVEHPWVVDSEQVDGAFCVVVLFL